MPQWFEDESFWIETYPFMFPEARFQAAEEEVDNLLQLADVKSGSVLDLCCGPGRFSIPLARRGFSVTGTDRTPFLLNKAIARAAEEGLDIEWLQEDMREFRRPNSFDLALSLFSSFGYFDDKSEDIKVLENIFVSLMPGGVVVMDLMGKERLARIFLPTTSEKLADGTVMFQRHEILDEWTRIQNEWIIVKGSKVQSFKFHHTIYSGQELKDRLVDVGFRDVKLYGSFEGVEYGWEADRLICVGHKPVDSTG